MVVVPFDKLTVDKALHPLKMLLESVLRVAGIVMVCKLVQPLNKLIPTVLSLLDRVTLVSDEQLENAPSPMEVTQSCISALVRLVQL